MDMLNKFLCLLVRGNLTQEEKEYIRNVYNRKGKDEIRELVTQNKVLPFAARTFCECGVDGLEWQQVLNEYRERNKNILVFLNEAYKTLHLFGVQKIFVSENFGALLSAGEDLGLFTSGDVDNFAPLSERSKIYKAMDHLGCNRKERFTGKNQIAAEFFPPDSFGLPKEFYFSVDFYPLARLKLPCFVDEKNFIDWDELHYYGNTEIALAPPDALMYICMLHVSLHSFCRAPGIRLYVDLLNMSKLNIDYEKLASWGKRDGTCTRLGVAREISNKLMNTQIPDKAVSLSRQAKCILRLVFDRQKGELLYEPKSFKVLMIEIMCDDRSFLHGILELIHPNVEWMIRTYGSSSWKAYINHILRIL